MKRLLLTAPMLYALLPSCGTDRYAPDDVQIEAEGRTERGIELRFVVPPESAYYCPGLQLEYAGEQVRYSFVRSHIDRKPSVDAKAEYRDGELVAVVAFPPGRNRIELIDPSGRSLGAWQASPSRP